MKNYKFLVLIFSFTFYLLPFTFCSYAQEQASRLVVLTKQIMETQDSPGLFALFNELKDLYFGENKYKECIEILKSLARKQGRLEAFTNYYIALARYHQLKYLEEKQLWDEYFSEGNTYREEIITCATKTVEETTAKDKLHLYARLVLWQFHKDQDDVFQEEALSDLMDAALEYAQNATEIAPLKDIADTLFSYNERGKAKELYKIYVEQLASSNINDSELEKIAASFFKEGNLELSELVYDIYIERVRSSASQENPLPILKDIARVFSYNCKKTTDAVYAEKIFKEIEEIGTKDAFDEELMYLRAWNLEKSKEYLKTAEIYKDLIQRYPQALNYDEANFKLGIISTYIFRDIKSGRDYFKVLAPKENISPQVISGLYQLGLLSQWEGDFLKATEYYNKLIRAAGADFKETVALTQERQKEINEARPIEYNLKIFLDVSLKEENAIFDTTKVDLRCCASRVKKEESVNINSNTMGLESGCMQPEVQYLWSGHTGTAELTLQQSSYDTTYIHPGTKEINLVVVSPTGIIDRNIDMVDVD